MGHQAPTPSPADPSSPHLRWTGARSQTAWEWDGRLHLEAFPCRVITAGSILMNLLWAVRPLTGFGRTCTFLTTREVVCVREGVGRSSCAQGPVRSRPSQKVKVRP